jgi:hypothetical protein
MYVSTLAHYLQAVGADLEIRAVFPDGRAVKISPDEANALPSCKCASAPMGFKYM